MQEKEEQEFDLEAKNALDLLQALKNDSEYFIKKAQEKDNKFSLEKDEENLQVNERELRWHQNVNLVLDQLLVWRLKDQRKNNEISELKNLLEEKSQEIVNIQADFIMQKSVLVEQINILTQTVNKNFDAFLKFRNTVESDLISLYAEINEGSERNFHSTPRNLQMPQMKMKPPNFGGARSDRPMQFLSEIRKYIDIMQVTDDSLMPILQQCLTKSASNW